jgi:hypothetical protein
MESMLHQGHRFLGGINHFWMAVRVYKTNLVLEDLARQKTDENVTKVRILLRSDRCLTVRMNNSVLRSFSDSEKGSSFAVRDCRHLAATSRQCSQSHYHLRERMFGQKMYISGSAATILA